MPIVVFQCMCNNTKLGDQVYLVGDLHELGSWNPLKGAKMETSPDLWPKWRTNSLILPASSTAMSYKYVLINSAGDCQWESFEDNRSILLQDDGSYTVYNHWGANTYDHPIFERPTGYCTGGVSEILSARCIPPVAQTSLEVQSIRNNALGRSTKAESVRSWNRTPAVIPINHQQQPPVSPHLTVPFFETPTVDTATHLQPPAAPRSAAVFVPSPATAGDPVVLTQSVTTIPVSSSNLLISSSGGPRWSTGVERSKLIPSKEGNLEKNFEILGDLGEGTWGTVLRVRDRRSGAIRAAKQVPKGVVEDLVRFRMEVETLKRLDHPNIVKLFESYESESDIFMILELCEGGELFDRIIASSSPFNENTVCKILHQILSALAYCHGAGIAHRDIKPENFLFSSSDPNSPIKLIDFGLAISFDPKSIPPPVLSTRVGTPYYVAPEVLEGRYDAKCDVWSVGVLMYLLLVGYPPFNGRNDAQIMQSVRKARVLFPLQDWSNISPDAIDLVQRLLTKSVSMRPSAHQALQHSWFTKLNSSTTSSNLGYHKQIPLSAPPCLASTTHSHSGNLIHGSSSGIKLHREPSHVYDVPAANFGSGVPGWSQQHQLLSAENPSNGIVTHSDGVNILISSENSYHGKNNNDNLDLVSKFRRFQSLSRLKRLVLTVLAQQSDDAEVAELRSLFLEIDLQNKGAITLLDIQNFLSKGGTIPADLPKVFSDVSTDDTIEYTEFIAACLRRKHLHRESLCRAAFAALDLDGDGILTKNDFISILGETGLTTEEAHLLHDSTSYLKNKTERDGDDDNRADLDFDAFFNMIKMVPSVALLDNGSSSQADVREKARDTGDTDSGKESHQNAAVHSLRGSRSNLGLDIGVVLQRSLDSMALLASNFVAPTADVSSTSSNEGNESDDNKKSNYEFNIAKTDPTLNSDEVTSTQNGTYSNQFIPSAQTLARQPFSSSPVLYAPGVAIPLHIRTKTVETQINEKTCNGFVLSNDQKKPRESPCNVHFDLLQPSSSGLVDNQRICCTSNSSNLIRDGGRLSQALSSAAERTSTLLPKDLTCNNTTPDAERGNIDRYS